MKPLPLFVPTIIILVSIIHARFINIDNLSPGNGGQFGYKSLPLDFIPLPVAVGLFFRVKPIFLKAREIVRELISPSQSEAISTWVLSPWVKAFSRNFSQSLILWALPFGLLGNAKKSPVSVCRFNHKPIVLQLILNSILASLIFKPSSLIAWMTFWRRS